MWMRGGTAEKQVRVFINIEGLFYQGFLIRPEEMVTEIPQVKIWGLIYLLRKIFNYLQVFTDPLNLI